MNATPASGLHPARAAVAERLGWIVRLSTDDIARFAASAGVSVRALRTARRGLPVAVDAHLGLCRALRLDPATGAAVQRHQPCGRVRWDHVRASLVCARAGAGLTLRAAAERIGIGAATLLRAERGEAVSVEVFLKLCQWLGMLPAHLTDEAPCWKVGAAARRRGTRACGAGPLPASPEPKSGLPDLGHREGPDLGHARDRVGEGKGAAVSRATPTETGVLAEVPA